MDYYKQFQEHNRVAVFELKGEVETRLRPYWYAQNTLMGAMFRGRLPANWREQWRATCAEQAEQGIITDPKSIQEIEDYLESWAKFCGLEPLQKQPTSTATQTRPTPAPQQKKTSGHRPGKKRVSPREALFFRHLARAQRYLDEIEAAIASLGAKIDAAHVGEEVDATPDVDRVEDLIWSYNDSIESARETWLRENLSGALNERLLSLNTPVKYGMPLYTDEAQERRAMLQGLEISRRLMGRNAVMDRIVATMQTIEIAGDVAGIALGAGAVITIVKKGGKWALVKTVIRGVVVDTAARAAERALEEAGVDQATLGGAKFAATLIKLILRRRIRAVGNGETPPPQRPPKAPPNPPPGQTPPPGKSTIDPTPGGPRPGTGLVPTATGPLGEWGETRLRNLYGNGFKPRKAYTTSTGKRFVDWMANGVAHESKAGLNVKPTPEIEKQVLKDAELVANNRIAGAHWHFWQGASAEMLDLLKKHGIPYTVH